MINADVDEKMEKQDFIDRELAQVKRKYEDIEGVQLISCVRVLVQLKYVKTAQKQLVCCFQFPADYPRSAVVMELKSKSLAPRLLDGLTKVCEQQLQKLIGQQQVLEMMVFVKRFVEEHPLCVCSDEVNRIRAGLLRPADDMKLRQRSSQLLLRLRQGAYHLAVRLTVPDNYPVTQLGIEVTEHNFPANLATYFHAQAEELARQCVQAPLKKNPKAPPFVASPALYPVVEHFIKQSLQKYPTERCPVCGKQALPSDPQDIVTEPSDDAYIERVYCDHLFHRGCLDRYMKKPPFTGGKKCPTCGSRIFHDKWKLPPQLQEARWAHKEARQRELEEVVDFLE